MGATSLLQRLLGEFPAEQFVREHYLRLPFARSGGVSNIVSGAGLELVHRLLEQKTLDGIVGRRGALETRFSQLSLDVARQHLIEGATLGFRGIHRNDDRMAELAEQLERELGGAADIHLYWTPAGQPGFGWHYDAEEVFLLQLDGGKKWSLRKNTVHPWPLKEAIPQEQRYGREVMPVMECRLTAGDWLYLPSGYWHQSQAGEESISLSIGIEPICAVDLCGFLRSWLSTSLEWRERLPLLGTLNPLSEEELVSTYRPILQRLSKSLANEVQQEAFLTGLIDFLRQQK